MRTEQMLPIEYDDADSIGSYHINWYNVTFTSDFGPIKAGDKFPSITLRIHEGKLDCWGQVVSEDGRGSAVLVQISVSIRATEEQK